MEYQQELTRKFRKVSSDDKANKQKYNHANHKKRSSKHCPKLKKRPGKISLRNKTLLDNRRNLTKA